MSQRLCLMKRLIFLAVLFLATLFGTIAATSVATAQNTFDVLIQAGHEGRTTGNTGATGSLGNEIDWTPIVADEATRILTEAGVSVARVNADEIEGRTYQVNNAVFIHFEGNPTNPCGVGASVGYNNNSDKPAAEVWKTLYDRYWPYEFGPDNSTPNLRDYYGYKSTNTSDAEMVLEMGSIGCLEQAKWLQPRLKWQGALIAHFLSQRTGKGNIPDPGPFENQPTTPPTTTPPPTTPPVQGPTPPSNLYQLHDNGWIWEYTGTPCSGESCPGWQPLDKNPKAIGIVAAGQKLYQLHDDRSIWQYTGTPCIGDSCPSWQPLDKNSKTTAIAAAGDKLYQLHNDGWIWEYTGTPCNGGSCPGWQPLDKNSRTRAIAAAGDKLYQLHNDGWIWEYTGTPCIGDSCTGWQPLDKNPKAIAIAATGNKLFQLHDGGLIWEYTGTPCNGDSCTGWQPLDKNPKTIAIIAGNDKLYQLHDGGLIWEYTGTPCSGDSCPGWQPLDKNPKAIAIAAAGNKLYQLHDNGWIWEYTRTPCNGDSCTGWQPLDKNPKTKAIAGTKWRVFNLPSEFGSFNPITEKSRENVTPDFLRKVFDISEKLDTVPEYLMAVMAFETGGSYSPSVKSAGGSGAVGLIQFLPETAQELGTTTAQLASLTAIQQLDYVEQYFLKYKGRLTRLEDVYMAVFTPLGIGKSPEYALYRRGTKEYEQNIGLDTNKNGVITVGEATNRVREKLPGAELFAGNRVA